MSRTTDQVPKKRVLWITNIANPYRIPVWQSLNEKVDLEIALLAETEPNRFWSFEESEIGINTHFLNLPVVRFGEISLYWPNRKMRALLRQDFDVFILGGWESPAYFYSLWVAKRRGIKTVGHYGSTLKSHRNSAGFLGKIRACFYKRLDWHISYGLESTEALVAMGVRAEIIATGFNSVDHQYFHNGVSKFRELPATTVGHFYLFVGRLVALKNLHQAIRAFAMIRQDKDIFRIVGSGPEEEKLKELVGELSLSNSVIFCGPKSGEALLEEYANAHTLVLPSTNEIWGLVVNEALASGLHVVVSNHCGSISDIRHMRGVYVTGVEKERLAQQMFESKRDWNGYLNRPEILAFKLGSSSENFSQAILREI